MAYLSLAFAAFLAATILPAQSEALLVALLLEGSAHVGLLLLAASLGNTLGSVVNWWLGHYVEKFRNRRWFPVSDKALQQAQQRFQRYGYWSLLLSWMPIIGDPLTVIAGIMRMPLAHFIALVALAKTGRYAALTWLTLYTV